MRILVIILSLFIVSCSQDQTRVNGIDQEHFEESLQTMEHELPSDQAPKLQEAVYLISTYDTHQSQPELRESRTRQMLNKKNADQIFTMAESTAQRNGIKWDRNSLGPLDIAKINDPKKNKNPQKSQSKELQNALGINVRTKQLDQNGDGSGDALMVFVEMKDAADQPLTFENEEVMYDVKVYNNNEVVFSRKQKNNSSTIGKMALNRGIILPYSAFDAENMKSNQVNVSVSAITPYNYFTSETPKIDIDYNQFVQAHRVNKEEIERDKDAAKVVVNGFLNDIGSGNLKQAHSYSVNPEWNNYANFESENLGFGGVQGVAIGNIEMSNFDSAKEKATVNATYTFTMKDGQTLELKKNYFLQKIAGVWKIVGTKKIN